MFKLKNILSCELLKCMSYDLQLHRNVIVFKRRYPMRLLGKGRYPRRLRAQNFIYDVLEDTEAKKKPDLQLLLIKYVEGIGQPGELVNVRPQAAYQKLLLPGYAVYPTEENVTKYSQAQLELTHSSKHSQRTVNILSHRMIPIIMNKDESWTLQPWHVRVHLRKAGIVVPEDAITMPNKEIKGPSAEVQRKEFPIKITVNNTETVLVRCRIHQWSTKLEDKIPFHEYHWTEPCQPLFPEDEPILNAMPGLYQRPTRDHTMNKK